jgi:hypothetical protein
MPFEPKMTRDTDLVEKFNDVVTEVQEGLIEHYPGDMVLTVSGKLEAIIRSLNFETHQKSIAIYVSPCAEKVLYLDINVRKRIIFDRSFDISDVLNSKRRSSAFVLLFLGGRDSSIYLGTANTLIQTVANACRAAPGDIRGTGGQATAGSGAYRNKEDEGTIQNCFSGIDNTLGIILEAYQLPLFVAGNSLTLREYSMVTRHKKAVTRFLLIQGGKTTNEDLKTMMRPHLGDWQRIKAKHLLYQIEQASEQKNLVVGIADVCSEASRRRRHLLVVEQNFVYAAGPDGGRNISSAPGPCPTAGLGDIMENVLKNGGDVEFVAPGMLKQYKHIVLINYKNW